MKVIKIKSSEGGLAGKSTGSEKAPDMIQKTAEEVAWLNESGEKPLLDFQEDVDINEAVKAPVVFLGGDHSISYDTIKAFCEQNDNAGVIVFDAHPDLMDDADWVDHETFLGRLIKDGVLRKENLILVGTQSWGATEYQFIKQNKIKCFTMKEISFEGKEDVCNHVMAAARGFGALYVSIDIDCVNSAEAPGTGYAEPAGLTGRELIYFLHRLKNLKNWKASDIVEVNPDKDIEGRTVRLAAKILLEIS